MSNLQKLLDERYPANGDLAHDFKISVLREAFTQGYNAAIGLTSVEVLQYRGLLAELARFLALEKYKQYPKEIQRLLDKYPNRLEWHPSLNTIEKQNNV